MKTILIWVSVVMFFSTLTGVFAAAPEEAAVTQYRAYVMTVRAGQIDNMEKRVEPVPENCRPLMTAYVKQAISVEALKKEMVVQMGPPKAGEESEMGGLPDDEQLKDIKGVVHDENTVGLISKDPKSATIFGWMVRRDGKWVVPAGLVMNLEPGAQFVTPEAEERQQMLTLAESTTKAADAVLKRLRNKEFKKPAEVQQALAAEMQKAGGDEGRGRVDDDGRVDPDGD